MRLISVILISFWAINSPADDKKLNCDRPYSESFTALELHEFHVCRYSEYIILSLKKDNVLDNPTLAEERIADYYTQRSGISDYLATLDAAKTEANKNAPPRMQKMALPALALPLAGEVLAATAARVGILLTRQRILRLASSNAIKETITEVHSQMAMTDEEIQQTVRRIESVNFSANMCDRHTVNKTDDSVTQVLSHAKQIEQSSKRRQEYCRDNPKQCCEDFITHFKKDRFANRYKFERQSGHSGGKPVVAYKVTDGEGKFRCCLEMDAQHGGWEIFNDKKDRKAQHAGERSCTDRDNDTKDICLNTLGSAHTQADPTGAHAPRSKLCAGH